MREQLIKYIEFLFKDTPEKEDLKNEIMSNTLDKFDDLVSGGMSEDNAFNCSVSGLGDISSLISHGKSEKVYAGQKPRAFMLALAVALYILSLLPVIIFDDNERLGPSLMFVMIAVATAIIIYRAAAFKKYDAKADAEIETKAEENGKNTVKNSIKSAIWALCIVAYFVVSFSTNAWYVTWVIFIIGAALSNIVNAAFSLRK